MNDFGSGQPLCAFFAFDLDLLKDARRLSSTSIVAPIRAALELELARGELN